MKDYHINIFYSAEDQGYIADIPELKYCSELIAQWQEETRGISSSMTLAAAILCYLVKNSLILKNTNGDLTNVSHQNKRDY